MNLSASDIRKIYKAGQQGKRIVIGGVRKTRNVEQGFVGGDGRFHPIRASSDYDSSRAGDDDTWEPPKKTKRRKR